MKSMESNETENTRITWMMFMIMMLMNDQSQEDRGNEFSASLRFVLILFHCFVLIVSDLYTAGPLQ